MWMLCSKHMTYVVNKWSNSVQVFVMVLWLLLIDIVNGLYREMQYDQNRYACQNASTSQTCSKMHITKQTAYCMEAGHVELWLGYVANVGTLEIGTLDMWESSLTQTTHHFQYNLLPLLSSFQTCPRAWDIFYPHT